MYSLTILNIEYLASSAKRIAAVWDQASLSPAIQLHTTVPQFPTMHALAGETDSLCM